jgi:hypothetical protein
MARRKIARKTAAPKRRALAPEATTRAAEVVLDVDFEGDVVELVLTSAGDAVATDVHVDFSRALMGIDGSVDLARLPVFERLGVLRPGRVLRIFWDSASALLGRGGGKPFVATVTWSERSRRRQRAEYRHDPSIYKQLPVCASIRRCEPSSR